MAMKNNGFRLKGHVKLTLSDAKTGRTKTIVEGENVITDALKDIFGSDELGMIDYSKLYGTDGIWKNWLGGIVCYNQQHENLDTTDYFMPSATDNPVIAHAGQTSIDASHDDDLTRGNPVGASYVETENSHKVVFEWGATQGNGIIRSLSLCHSDVGSYGNGVKSYHFKNSFQPFVDLKTSSLSSIYTDPLSGNNVFAKYDDYHGISFVIGDDGEYDGNTRAGTDLETDKLTVYIRRLPYRKTGLFETLTPRQNFVRKFTVEDLPFTLITMPSFYFDPETKYLWIFSNITGIEYDSFNIVYNNSAYTNNEVNYAVIDCNEYENEPASRIVTSGTLNTTANDLAPTSIAKWRSNLETTPTIMFEGDSFHGIIVDGDYIYLPTTSGIDYGPWYLAPRWYHNGYRKFNKSTGDDEGLIEFNESFRFMSPSMVVGGLVVRNGVVCNGDVGYSCVKLFSEPESRDYRNWYFQEVNKAVTAVFPRFWGGLTWSQGDMDNNRTLPRYILACKLLNTSKINLSQAVQKTTSENMRIEYIITEIDPYADQGGN